jgi:putative transposase
MNNRIEGLGRFKSLRQAQRFLTAHDQINTFFRQRRYQISAVSDRHARADAFDLWSGYAAEMNA